MKRADVMFLMGIVAFFAPFFLSAPLLNWYKSFNTDHGILMSMLKFGILATLGEVIALRIKTGKYNQPNFGIIPRALVWSILGIFIKIAFVIFSTSSPLVLKTFGINIAPDTIQGAFSLNKLLLSFTISLTMNTMFAPVMMILHKITDEHIIQNGGTILGLFQPIKVRKIISKINWDTMWDFVFKKTIPLFWIPAHTITFLLPPEHQILFAAFLGIFLGILLALASMDNAKAATAK